jgi:hypothetical protein
MALHQPRVAQRGEVDKDHPVGEVPGHPVGHLNGQPGLAHPTRPGERQQLGVAAAEQFHHGRRYPGPADQRGERPGQGPPGEFGDGCHRTGAAGWPGRREQLGARRRIRPEGIGQQGHRAQPRRAGRVAFQITDGLGAEPSPLGQAFLSQSRRQPLALQQCTETGRPPRRHRPYPPVPGKKGGNGESSSCCPVARPLTLGSG